MRSRLIVLAALLAVAGMAGGLLWAFNTVLERGTGAPAAAAPASVNAPQPGAAAAYDDGAVWARENDYINHANAARWPIAAPMTPQLPVLSESSGDPVRVLVLGDSSTWGHGVEDADMRWPDRLQRELDARTSPGAFKITTIAERGASTFSEAGWLTPDLLATVRPELILVGHNSNDVQPVGLETVLCDGTCETPLLAEHSPVYQACLEGNPTALQDALKAAAGVLPELAKRLQDTQCNLDELASALGLPTGRSIDLDPVHSPYFEYFVDAVTRIRQAVGDGIAMRVVTPTGSGERKLLALTEHVFADAGFVMAPMPRTNALAEPDMGAPGNFVNPGNQHPGPLITAAVAADAADAILAALPTGRVAAAQQAAVPPRRPLVSNFLPAQMQVQSTDRTAVVVNPVAAADAGSRSWLAGVELPPQSAPCAAVGRPHARVMLDPALPAGTLVQVTLEDSVTGPLQLLTAGYGPAGYTTASVGTLDPGRTLELTTSDAARGLLLAVPDGSCDLRSPVTMPPFTLTVTAR